MAGVRLDLARARGARRFDGDGVAWQLVRPYQPLREGVNSRVPYGKRPGPERPAFPLALQPRCHLGGIPEFRRRLDPGELDELAQVLHAGDTMALGCLPEDSLVRVEMGRNRTRRGLLRGGHQTAGTPLHLRLEAALLLFGRTLVC